MILKKEAIKIQCGVLEELKKLNGDYDYDTEIVDSGISDLHPKSIQVLKNLVGDNTSEYRIWYRPIYGKLNYFIEHFYYTQKSIPRADYYTTLCFTDSLDIYDTYKNIDRSFYDYSTDSHVSEWQSMLVIYNPDYKDTLVLKVAHTYEKDKNYGELLQALPERESKEVVEEPVKQSKIDKKHVFAFGALGICLLGIGGGLSLI